MKKTFILCLILFTITNAQAQVLSDSVWVYGSTTIPIWRDSGLYSGSGKLDSISLSRSHSISESDSIKAEILQYASECILNGKQDEFILIYIILDDLIAPNFYEHKFLGVFPETLLLHVRNKSVYQNAARELLLKFFPNRL